jgi:nucleotide-binding universal stress UspA family protein
MDFEVGRVLVPVDKSDRALDAADYAVAVAARYGADVHALYVIGERTARTLEAGAVSPEAVATESSDVLDYIRERAAEEGVETNATSASGFSTDRKSLHPGSVILDTAEAVGADFIVVPRETGAETTDVLEKAAEYVLLYASEPVLSV